MSRTEVVLAFWSGFGQFVIPTFPLTYGDFLFLNCKCTPLVFTFCHVFLVITVIALAVKIINLHSRPYGVLHFFIRMNFQTQTTPD